MRSWGEDKDVHTPEDLMEVTEEAVDRGAFGAPTMYFTEEGREEEMFWGSDRFDMIAHCFDKQWHGPDPGK